MSINQRRLSSAGFLFRQLIVLFLLPALVLDPSFAASAKTIPQTPHTDLRQRFQEEALAGRLYESPLHVIEPENESLLDGGRSQAGRYLLEGRQLGSVIAQDLSRSRPTFIVKAAGFLVWGSLWPAILVHELGHIVFAIPMLLRGEIQLNNIFEILKGRPFRGPPVEENRLPAFPRYQRWLGFAFNLATVVLIAGLTAFRILPLSAWSLFQNPSVAWVAHSNLALLIAEPIWEWMRGRGELFSLKFEYDNTYPELLSVKEGKQQLVQATEEYLLKGEFQRSGHVALIRFDTTFRDIIEKRIGAKLSTVLRQRTFARVVEKLRNIPGTLVAATEDENQVMAILPTEAGDRRVVLDDLDLLVSSMYNDWLKNGFAIARMEGLKRLRDEIIQNRSEKAWRKIEQHLAAAGIHVSDYAGGTALIIKPDARDPFLGVSKGPMDTRDLMRYLAAVLDRENRNIHDMGLEGSLQVAFIEGTDETPVRRLSLSAVATAFHKADGMIAWEDIGNDLDLIPNPSTRFDKLRHYMEDRYPAVSRKGEKTSPNRKRSGLLLSHMERSLQSLLKATQDRLNTVAIQRAPASSLVVLMEDQEHPDRVSAVPLLGKDLKGQAIMTAWRDPVDERAQQEAREAAELALLHHEVRFDVDVRRERDNFQKIRAIHHAAMEQPGRVKTVYLSAWTKLQARQFAELDHAGVYPPGTRVEAIADPSAPDGTRPYGRAGGNGVAILGIVRQFFEEFVRLHPKPGLYNLYVEMAGEGFMSLFGGGRSTRAHENVYGKPQMSMPILRRPNSEGDVPQPAKLEELFSETSSAISYAMPRTSAGRDLGFYTILYGDALATFNPDELAGFFDADEAISDGVTLIFRRVPFSEAIDWGVAKVDRLAGNLGGRIELFDEKPGLEIIKNTKEIELLKHFNKGASPEELSAIAGKLGVQRPITEILEELRLGLKDRGLLIDGQYILMNTAIGVSGTASLIRLLRASGAQIDDHGNYCVGEEGIAPFDSGDPDSILTRTQDWLAGLNESVPNPQGLSRVISDKVAQLEKEAGERGDPSGNHRRAIQILRPLIAQVPNTPQSSRNINIAIADLGRTISILDRVLRDGVSLDGMRHIVSKMGLRETSDKRVFEEAITELGLKAKQEGRAEYVAAYEQALGHLEALKRQSNENSRNFDRIANDLEIEMARLRAKIGTARDAEPWVSIYKCFAMVSVHQRLWQVLRGTGAGSAAYGYVTNGAWLDTGATQNNVENFLRSTPAAKRLSAIFSFSFPLYSAGRPGHRIGSDVSSPNVEAHPASLQVGFTRIHPLEFLGDGGRTTIEEGTAVYPSDIPFPIHLYPGSVIDESVVFDSLRRPFVTYAVWQQEPDPDRSSMYFGSPMVDWLQSVDGLNPAALWPGGTNMKNPPLYRAKIFPGISLKLMEAARTGTSEEDLHRHALKEDNDLDWRLIMALNQIYDWLQHRAGEQPPAVWREAQLNGRLFSMQDSYSNAAWVEWSRRRARTAQLVDESIRRQNQIPLPAVRGGYWMTDADRYRAEHDPDSANGRLSPAANSHSMTTLELLATLMWLPALKLDVLWSILIHELGHPLLYTLLYPVAVVHAHRHGQRAPRFEPILGAYGHWQDGIGTVQGSLGWPVLDRIVEAGGLLATGLIAFVSGLSSGPALQMLAYACSIATVIGLLPFEDNGDIYKILGFRGSPGTAAASLYGAA